MKVEVPLPPHMVWAAECRLRRRYCRVLALKRAIRMAAYTMLITSVVVTLAIIMSKLLR